MARYGLVYTIISVYTVCQLYIQLVSTDELCDYNKALGYLKHNQTASDDHAVLCADSTPRTSFALLFQTCPGINYDWNHWKPLFKVQGNCTEIPKGTPLINYYRTWPLAGAIFMECVNGTDIKVAIQNCDPVHYLVVDNATLYETFIYTVLW